MASFNSPSAPSSPFKPLPLNVSNSPRASPFKRQNSSASNPSSPSGPPTLRSTTPTSDSRGTAASTRPATPSKLHAASTPSQDAATFSPRLRGGAESPTKLHGVSDEPPPSAGSPRTVRGPGSPAAPPAAANATSTPGLSSSHRASPVPAATHRSSTFPTSARPGPAPASSAAARNLDALARLPPQLVRSLRDAFSLLDRDSTGTLTPADVTAMHAQLGLPPPTSTELGAYFPPGAPTPLALPAFLGGLAAPLAQLDQGADLLEALGAFDEMEGGTVAVEELVAALGEGAQGLGRREVESVVHGFTGRPRLGKGGTAGGEVFRYREWVAHLGAGGEGGKVEA